MKYYVTFLGKDQGFMPIVAQTYSSYIPAVLQLCL